MPIDTAISEMRFGLQKLTLLDFPGRMACTVFTCGCNYRCPFCHNGGLVTGHQEEMALSAEELFSFLEKRVKILDGVCITGGEPLLHQGTVELLAAIKQLGYRTKLDTNGSFPERLQQVLERHLADYVAVDIKNSPAKYAMTCGLPTDGENQAKLLAKMERSIALLKAAKEAGDGFDYEFRTTVVRGFHQPGDFKAIGQWIQGAPHYYLQSFKDSGDVLALSEEMAAMSDTEMAGFLDEIRPYLPNAALRGR